MADKRTGNFAAADAAAGQSDPFAELTRIMGFAPPQEEVAQDGFSSDLEDELVRELDGADHAASHAQIGAHIGASPDDDLPVIHLSHPDAGAAVSQDADDLYLDGDDEAVRELEDEFNALLGNSSMPQAGEHDVSAQAPQAEYVEAEDYVEEEAAAFADQEADEAEWNAEPVQAEAAPVLDAPEPVAPQPAVSDDPFAMLAAMAAKYKLSVPDEPHAPEPVSHAQPAPYAQPAPAHAGYVSSTHHAAPRVTAAPEIETIEVSERAVAVADDLDLPSLPVADEPQPVAAFDDIDTEFNNLLSRMSSHEPLPPKPAASAAQPTYQPAAYRPAVTARVAPVAAAPVAPQPAPIAEEIRLELSDEDLAGAFDDEEVAGYAYAGEEEQFDFDDGFGEDVPAAAYQNDKHAQPRRGLLIAAVVGGIVVLGAAGAIAMSMMGSAQGGSPALVKSDHSPIKVRPADPGGVTVPNQDSSVYETVANKQPSGAPHQDRLVNAAEEPVELVDELPDNADEDVADVDEPKSEDRIEQVAAEAGGAADTISVAPRKVRTVVVKPDGSLVPAEEPAKPQAAAKTAEPKAKDVAAKPEVKKDKKAVAAADETPAVARETTASIEAQPAPAGGWALQIASETSEEAAQAAYKKLVSRYPSLLGGKGVNIVKADVAGKGTRWRVRILSDSRNEAAGLCSSLKSAGGSCFVSKT